METTVENFAEACRIALAHAAKSPSVLRDVARQHKTMTPAIVPLLSLGNEWDMQALWKVVASLNTRLSGSSFSGDNPDNVRRLEAGLDEVSVSIIALLWKETRDHYGAISLGRGLVDGHWVIYAIVPRGARFAAPESTQASLWEM